MRNLVLLIIIFGVILLNGCVPDSEIIDETYVFKYDVKAENLQGINNIYTQEEDGFIWFTTETQGFLSYNLKTRQWEYYDLKKGLLSMNIFSFNVGEKEVWIGTDVGLMRLETGKSKPENYFGSTNNLLSQKINAICADKDIVWIGTPKGTTAWIKNPDIMLTVSQVSTAIDKDWIKFKKADGLVSNNILKIKSTEKRIYFGTNAGLTTYNKNYQEFKSYTKESGHLPNNFITDILIDDSYAWISTLEGVARFHTGFENWEQFNVNNGLPSNIIIKMETSPKALYLLTQDGLGKFEKNLNLWRTVLTKPFILNGDFTTLAVRNNEVYVGTSLGIYYSNNAGFSFKRLVIDGQTVNNHIYSIKTDSTGVWYSSDKGTFHFVRVE
ncbi:MAG: hypothetical protein PHV06_03860 [bacterium]|nr:hypothetical protein [bacterium]